MLSVSLWTWLPAQHWFKFLQNFLSSKFSPVVDYQFTINSNHFNLFSSSVQIYRKVSQCLNRKSSFTNSNDRIIFKPKASREPTDKENVSGVDVSCRWAREIRCFYQQTKTNHGCECFVVFELTRQFSYAVHWSPSIHRHSSVSAAKSEMKLISFQVFRSNFFWAYKLGKSLHYIRFIWCVVYTNDRGLPQTMLESWKERQPRKKKTESEKKKKFFFLCRRSTPSEFIFLIKLIREEQQQEKRPDKRCIKWIYSSMWRRSLFLKVMS